MKPILSFSLFFFLFFLKGTGGDRASYSLSDEEKEGLPPPPLPGAAGREQGVEREVKRKTIEANKKESAQAGLLLIALTVCPASSWGVSIFWRLDSLGSLESLSHTLGFSTWLQCQMMMQFDFTAAEGNIARILMYSVVVWHFLLKKSGWGANFKCRIWRERSS
jgi:hypothetical protein